MNAPVSSFHSLFPVAKPLIAVLHLPPLPGSHRWNGNTDELFHTAMKEAQIYVRAGADAVLMENFNDYPFYPDQVPASTVAAMGAIARELVKTLTVPVGINVLRNDAVAALSIAAASGAHFIRVNVHTGAMVTDQGLIQGRAYETLRLRSHLKSAALIFADVHVKHAAPLAMRALTEETKDLVGRGLADAVIVSGSGTGAEINPVDLQTVSKAAGIPVLTGSGVNLGNLDTYLPLADGFIVGSAFKTDGKADNPVEEGRTQQFVKEFQAKRARN